MFFSITNNAYITFLSQTRAFGKEEYGSTYTMCFDSTKWILITKINVSLKKKCICSENCLQESFLISTLPNRIVIALH